MGTQGVGTWTITWEYWDGDSWFSLSGVTDGTTGFTAATGNRDVTFTVPADWAMTEVDDIVGHAIRARVSAYTSITTQPKGTQAWTNSHYYDLPSKDTTNDSSLNIYIDDVEKTGGGTDFTFVSGGAGSAIESISFLIQHRAPSSPATYRASYGSMQDSMNRIPSGKRPWPRRPSIWCNSASWR
jgi:hypothetical protein